MKIYDKIMLIILAILCTAIPSIAYSDDIVNFFDSYSSIDGTSNIYYVHNNSIPMVYSSVTSSWNATDFSSSNITLGVSTINLNSNNDSINVGMYYIVQEIDIQDDADIYISGTVGLPTFSELIIKVNSNVVSEIIAESSTINTNLGKLSSGDKIYILSNATVLNNASSTTLGTNFKLTKFASDVNYETTYTSRDIPPILIDTTVKLSVGMVTYIKIFGILVFVILCIMLYRMAYNKWLK
jgi:hypothetical protein